MKNFSCSSKKIARYAFLVAALTAWLPGAQANLLLQSPTVIVEQSDGEGTMMVQNTSDSPLLMHVDILNIPEDSEDLILATPPVTRIDGGDTQLVRFIIKETAPLKTERFKRVTFEGIPQAKDNQLQLALRQNIGLVIRPEGLKAHDKPWTLLKWRQTDRGLSVENPSPYLVRILENITLLPGATTLSLPKNYLLPGETVLLASQNPLTAVEKVSFQPASINGFVKSTQEAMVEKLR